MTDNNQTLLDFALELAHAAEKEILPRYRKVSVHYKSDGTEVTEADREAEKLIRALIERRHPGHAILGEEFGSGENQNSDFLWVIDPVDGTSSFTLGNPLFGTLIGLLEQGEPVVGVIHFPALNETIFAAKGLGCWHTIGTHPPSKVTVRGNVPLQEAVITTTGIHSTNAHPEPGKPAYNLSKLVRRARKVRFGGDCYIYGLLCQGRVHAAFDTIMNPWDIAALVPCITEAGGIVSNLSGDRSNVVYGGNLLASCSATLHEEILEALR